jgi:3-hydroxybutyryl-CoA dehydrogenase
VSAERVVVVGAGTMGHGIAQVAAQAGYQVRLVDALAGAAARGIDRIRHNLEGAVERGKITAALRDDTLARVAASDDLPQAARDCVLAVEAVPESLDLKREVFRALEEALPPPALLATNTSSLSVTAIALACRAPERVLGMHFFNPVHLMKLVEVVVHPATDTASRDRALAVVRAMGKEPIVVKDSPGFASSRLGIVLGLEAMRMVEEGVASPEDIDRAMTLGYNHPMGPLRLTDVVGLDVRLAIAEYLHGTLKSAAFEPPDILRDMVKQGRLGRKSGRGFYYWTDQ